MRRLWSRASENADAGYGVLAADLQKLHGPFDTVRQIAVRREQAYLRKYLFSGRDAGACSLCGRVLPIELLVAAHIKRRSACSGVEKGDSKNVVPMCLLGCDALFERGYVWAEAAEICTVPPRNIAVELRPLLTELRGRTISLWTGRETYFGWHAARANSSSAQTS